MRLSIIILKGTEFKRKKKENNWIAFSFSSANPKKTKQKSILFFAYYKKKFLPSWKKNVSLGFSKPLDLHLTHYYYSW